MSKKILYFDVETTGRNPIKHDIVQLGLIIDIDGQIVAEENITCQPLNWDNIEPEALEITGNTIEKLKSYQKPHEAFHQLLGVLNNYIDRFDRTDKFYPAGYNVDFDLNFLSNFFDKNNDPYLGSYLNWRRLDPLPILYAMDVKGKISLPNYKLETVCEHFGIEIQAHDAFSDIKATRQLLRQLLKLK